jgi:hypothetical protein
MNNSYSSTEESSPELNIDRVLLDQQLKSVGQMFIHENKG